MNAAPSVSVIMNCFNSARYLREAIESVYAQSWQDWEIVFWDNASTDESPEIANSFDERLRYFRSETTCPLGEARNRALAQVRGRYITFLDCDDTWLPDKLVRQVDLLECRSDVDFVYGNYFIYDTGRGTKCPFHSSLQPEGPVFGQFLLSYPVGMLTVMIRQSVLERLDTMFDPNLRLAEEFDLFMRILYHGAAAYIAEPVAVYRVHEHNYSFTMRDGWGAEFRHCLERFRSIDIEGRYGVELAVMEWKIDYNEGLLLMVRGELSEARRKIAPHRFRSVKVFCVYLATFLPLRVWFLFRPLWGRHVYLR